MQSLSRLWGALLLLTGILPAVAQIAPEEAEGASRPWMLGVAAQLDDLDTDSLYATFNWAVTEKTWLYFSAGQSRFENSTSELTTDSFLAGFDRQFGRFGFSLDAEVWGDSIEVDSTDVRATGHFGGERYRLYFEMESRSVELSPVLTDRLELDVDGTGFGARARFDVAENWSVYLRAMSYDYEWASPTLPTRQQRDTLNQICTDAVALITNCDELRSFIALLERRNSYVQSTLANNSFLDSELSLDLEWSVADKLINFNFTKDRAIDQARSESRSFGASILFPISYRMDLEFNLGQSESDLYEPSTFGGLFFLLYGG